MTVAGMAVLARWRGSEHLVDPGIFEEVVVAMTEAFGQGCLRALT